jgi:membrane protease YdiL (CAAX protease family)
MESERFGWFLLFLFIGLAVFLPSITFSALIPDNVEILLRTSLCVLFFVAAIVFTGQKTLKKYWPIPFAFFLAALSQFFAWEFSGLPLTWFHLDATAVKGMAVAKFSQSLLVVIPIILLTRISGQSFSSIYLKKGKIRYGLGIGLIAFLVFAGLLYLQIEKADSGPNRLLSASPWILVFVLSNGLNEELLFRGLFLRKFEPFVGTFGSNLTTAIVFTLAHLKVEYVASGEILKFLATVFVLAMVWGYMMQKTESLIGPALFHAGADLLLFSSLFTLSPS